MRKTYRTRVAYVPCSKCGQDRTIRYQVPADIRRAEQRTCIPCRPGSNTPRPTVNDWQSEVDEVAVQRLVSGSRVRATRAERQAAVTYLVDRAVPNSVIAERIQASQRTVERLRQRMRSEATSVPA